MSFSSVAATRPVADRGSRQLPIRVTVLFALLGVILVAIGIQVIRATNGFIDENARVVRSLQVDQAVAGVVGTLRDAEASQRAYVISDLQARLDDYHAKLPQLTIELQRLGVLVAADPAQGALADALTRAVEQRRHSMNATLATYRLGGIDAVRSAATFPARRDEDIKVDALAAQLLAADQLGFAENQSRSLRRATLTRQLIVGATALCVAMLLAALALIVRENRRRRATESRLQASLVDLGRSLEESLRLADTLRQFSELASMLQGCRSVEEAVSGIRASMMRLLPEHAGAIQLIKASQNLVEAVTTWGEAAAQAESLFTPDDCWALRRGQTYPPAGVSEAFHCHHLGALDASGHLCVPLMAQGEMLGTLTIIGAEAGSPATRSIAETAAEQTSLALANLKLQEILRTQSLRDPLTGLYNRRYLEASFERELLRASRRNLPLSVLMLDIDHFKRFNDSHGHEAGDTLLAQFGALLTRCVRQEDVTCRYGGEEFAVLLQEADTDRALERAEAIRMATRELSVQHRRQALGPVTVSIGVATFPRDGTESSELLRSADRALYAAKHAGRDRVHSAGSPMAGAGSISTEPAPTKR